MGPIPYPRRRISPLFGRGNPSYEGLDRRLGRSWLTRSGASVLTHAREGGSSVGGLCHTGRVRVGIADDHRLVLDGIKRALESDGGFEIVGETQSGTQVLPLVGKTNPDLVLLDVRMPHMDGLACLDQLRTRHPAVKVVMLSASSNPELVEAALRRGASAYVIKTVNPDDLPATLRQALEGNVHTAVGGEETERASAKALGLTERELTILGALARGLSNDEIAKEFWVAPQTVKFHLTNIYRKLGVKNRTEATRIAYQHGLVESPIYADE